MAKELTLKKIEAPTPWQPFQDFARWEKEAERMMEQFFGRPLMPWSPARLSRSEPLADNAPTVDIFVEGDNVVITAELPGMEKNDIDVNLSDHLLTLKGEKRRKAKIKDENYYCAERTYGHFSRTLELPMDVRGEQVKATFANGVLEIRLPIAEAAKAKVIKVKVEEGPTSVGQD